MRARAVVTIGASFLAACAVGACGEQPPGDTGPDWVAELTEGGVRTCADPSRRSVQRFDRKQSAIPMLPAALLAGGGLVVEDLDGDGFSDLFLAHEHPDLVQIWWGAGDNAFVEAAATSFAGIDLAQAVGGTAVDYDADGDLDLFVTRWERSNRMLRNDGGRVFTDVTDETGLGATALKHQSASWADMDADGDLDLFVGAYGAQAKIEDGNCADHLPDGSALFRNRGDGTFDDVSELLPPEVHDGYVFASGWFDLDEDGYPELVTSHDDGLCAPSVIVDNVGGAAFVVDASSGFATARHDMGMAVGDLNGDELPDFALTSFRKIVYLESDPMQGTSNGAIWAEAQNPRSIAIQYTSPANQAYGWGAEFGDVDNDTDLDLAMAFGFWSYYTNGQDPRYQRDGLWIQDGSGQFSDQGAAWHVDDRGVGRGIVLADVNDDGWLDLLKRQLDDDTLMYLSRCGAESWVRVRLRDDGPNTFGVGAKIRVTAGGKTQVRWITAGSTGQYTGQPLEAHFGLGPSDTIDRLEIVWPDMRVSAFEDVAARQLLTVTRAPL